MNTKRFLFAASIFCLAIGSSVAKDNDPVLMTVDGNDVRLSEFEYLYNKNNAQQAQPITFDEYVRMFTDYKLKVADAHAVGVDTTAAFVQEFDKFRNELAAPYMVETSTLDRLARESYGRMAEELFVSHIMMPLANEKGADNKAFADSVRKAVLNGEITFEAAAQKYSVDKRSAINGGRMGWVLAEGGFPWQFEEMAFNTPLNGISEVVNSGFGYHIIRVDERRPAQGEVKAQHILLLTRGMSAEDAAKQKAKIDSIYQVAVSGADFSDLARRLSQDPGSAQRGGDLGWFGHGKMVAEFDSAAYATPEGVISKPFATAYGYHIVKNTGHRGGLPLPPFEEVRPQIDEAIQHDSRAQLPVDEYINNYAAKINAYINPSINQEVVDLLVANGYETISPEALEMLQKSNATAYIVNKKQKPVTLGEVLTSSPLAIGMPASVAGKAAAESVNKAYRNAVMSIARDELYTTNSEYRNLINEYRDGIMLFEVSNANVWDRAAKDKDGLEAFFQANKANYTWDAPKFKSYIIFAENDSVLALAKEYATQFDPKAIGQEAFTAEMKKRFGKDVKVERVIAGKGDNAITDFLAFGGEKPASNPGQKWSCYFAFNGQVVDAPQEASDVKGKVIADYQAYLEKQWVDQLRAKYPVKVNEKVMKKAKEHASK